MSLRAEFSIAVWLAALACAGPIVTTASEGDQRLVGVLHDGGRPISSDSPTNLRRPVLVEPESNRTWFLDFSGFPQRVRDDLLTWPDGTVIRVLGTPIPGASPPTFRVSSMEPLREATAA